MSQLPFDDSPSPEIDAKVARDLAALADGSLEPARRAEVEALAARSPELAAALAEQRSAVALTASAREISGSAQFHDGVHRLARRRSVYSSWPERGQRSRRSRADGESAPRRRKLGLAIAGGAALAAVAAIAIAASLGGHGSQHPEAPRLRGVRRAAGDHPGSRQASRS
jgi:anti-sigma factor RsiW